MAEEVENAKPILGRSTAELVLLILTTTVAILMLLASIGILLLALLDRNQDSGQVISSLFDVIKVIIGAVLGYAAGRMTSGGNAE